MEKDFYVGESCELVQAGRVFDLHNKFGFGGITVLPARAVRVRFEPDPTCGIGEPVVVLEFHDVEFLGLSSGFGTRATPDLDEFGYKNPQDSDLEWLLCESQATPQDHFLIRLGAIDFIRVYAGRAWLRVIETGLRLDGQGTRHRG